jgi:hypothetical protein
MAGTLMVFIFAAIIVSGCITMLIGMVLEKKGM